MNKELKEGFLSLVVDRYGSLQELAKILDLGIEMLFYLEEDTFDKREVQSVVSALRGIIKALRESECYSIRVQRPSA